MGKAAIIKEFFEFIRIRKKYWLIPLVFALLALGVILVLAESSALAPFIYTLF